MIIKMYYFFIFFVSNFDKHLHEIINFIKINKQPNKKNPNHTNKQNKGSMAFTYASNK